MSQDGGQKIRFCTSRDGVRLGFATCGTGPTVITAAHWISHLRLDWDNPVRRSWLSMLSRRNTLIRYDPRGTGLSDRDCADFTLPRQIEDLEAVVEAAKCDRFALLGLWTGGAVAVNYTVRHPERVTHLVLHACATRGRLVRDPTPEQLQEAEAQLKLIELGWGNENSAFRQLHTSQLIPDATPEQARAFNDLMRQTTTPANAAKLLRAHWAGTDNRSLGPRIKCPTLVLHAREDARIPFEEGRSLAALIPDARFVPLESRNHVLIESEPFAIPAPIPEPLPIRPFCAWRWCICWLLLQFCPLPRPLPGMPSEATAMVTGTSTASDTPPISRVLLSFFIVLVSLLRTLRARVIERRRREASKVARMKLPCCPNGARCATLRPQ